MLYKYLSSEKGFTMMEIFTVVIILGILTGVTVPLFSSSLKKQRISDCKNQAMIIETTVKQGLFGMLDNGKKQTMKVNGVDEVRINFAMDEALAYKKQYTDKNSVIHDAFMLTYDNCFTLGALRGGYRPTGIADYDEGCQQGYYLKKERLEDKPFYAYLDNEKIPVCPFADENNSQGYYYYVLEDGTVVCSGKECNEAR